MKSATEHARCHGAVVAHLQREPALTSTLIRLAALRWFFGILTALSMTWSSTSTARVPAAALCARGEARVASGNGGQHRHYAKARYLAPTTGRFLSLDPVQGVLSEPLSTQGFTYANANPTRFTDPDGRCAFSLDDEGYPRADCASAPIAASQALYRENSIAFDEGRYAAGTVGSILQVAFAPVLLAGVAADALLALPFNIGSATTSIHNNPSPDKVEALAVESAKAAMIAVDPALAAVKVDAALAGRGLADAGRRGVMTLESIGAKVWNTGAETEAVALGGVAQRPRLTWNANAEGVVRTADEARAILKEAGVDPGYGIKLEFVERSQLRNPEGALAEYGTFAETQPNAMIQEDKFFDIDMDGNIPIRIDSSLLMNDEAMVAHVAHELHEVNGLVDLFAGSGGRLPARAVKAANAPNRGQNLHGQAWDEADAAVARLRAARGSKQ